MKALAEAPIEWFHRNLELLVEDIELGDRTEIFFDASDFTSIILGMYSFFKKTRTSPQRSFDWKSFQSDPVLVHCLATAGWLGKVKMLPPHQVELLQLLKKDFDLADVGDKPWDLAKRFLAEGQKQGHLAAEADEKVELQLEELTGSDLVHALSGKAELAKEIFKLLQEIKGSWRTRFLAWNEQNLFEDLDRFDPVPYLEDGLFRRVRSALDESRGKRRSISNFTDALAVTLLARRTRDFDQGAENAKLPLFFLHEGRLRDAIQRSGLEVELQYHPLRDGIRRTFPVLRDWRYFYFRATFGQDSISNDELRALLEQTSRLREGKGSEVRDEALIALDRVAEIKVGEQIERMREFRFFHTYWLKSTAEEIQRIFAELKRANLEHDRLESAVTELQSDGFKEKVQEGQGVLDANYKASVGTYPRAIELLKKIDARIQKIYKSKTGGTSPAEMMLALGLFRFPFPGDVYSRIERTLGDLVAKGERRAEAQATVVTALLTSSRDKLDLENLAFIFGMLWATELDSEIIELGEQWHTVEAPWFLLVWASALLRESEDKRHSGQSDASTFNVSLLWRGYQLLQAIKKVQHATREAVAKASLAVGIAFLDFHFFEALLSNKWGPQLSAQIQQEDLPVALLQDAVDQTQQAWQTEGLGERLRVYALNQLTYYRAEGVLRRIWEFADVEKELRESARQLKGFEKVHPYWHYRYDDTLARYHEVVGHAQHDRQEWEAGKVYVERAHENCFADPLITGTVDKPGYYREYLGRYDAWMQEHPETAVPAVDGSSTPD